MYGVSILDSTTVATIAVDINIVAVGKGKMEAKEKPQQTVNAGNARAIRRRNKLNETRSTHIDFTNRRIHKSSLILDNNVIPIQLNT